MSGLPSVAVPDARAVEALVRAELDLVPILAKQMRRQLGPRLDVEELESVGREALFGAAQTFDPSRGVPFRRWANLRMRGAILDWVRVLGGVPRRVYQKLRMMEASDRYLEGRSEEDAQPPATPEAADRRLGESLAGMAMAAAAGFLSPESEGLEALRDEDETAEEAIGRKQVSAVVRAAVEGRPENERKLLQRHYFDGLTLEKAAAEQGLSKSWGSRLHARAIDAVASELRRRRDDL